MKINSTLFHFIFILFMEMDVIYSLGGGEEEREGEKTQRHIMA